MPQKPSRTVLKTQLWLYWGWTIIGPEKLYICILYYELHFIICYDVYDVLLYYITLCHCERCGHIVYLTLFHCIALYHIMLCTIKFYLDFLVYYVMYML